MSVHSIYKSKRIKMPRTATIQTRIDQVIKTQAQEILGRLNISMSEAVSLFLTQVTLHRGIPFDVKIPNAQTAETIRKAEAGQELHHVSSVTELFQELES